ncbi:MAG: hypothetical protein Q9160_008088 [Pyrenula sp. 1 TL-2023]
MPSRRKRSKIDEPQFLFVNEGPSTEQPTNICFSSGRSKQSHVQRLYFERKRQAVLERTSSDPLPSQHQPSPEVEARCSSDDQDERDASNSSKNLKFDSKVSEEIENSANLQQNNDFIRRGQAVKADRSPLRIREGPAKARSKTKRRHDDLSITRQGSNRSDSGVRTFAYSNRRMLGPDKPEFSHDLALNFIPVVAGGYIDPFDSTVVQIDEWAHTLISYYMMVVIPSIFRADSQATKAQLLNQSRHNSALFEDIQNCLSDRAHFYALLTSAASRMLRVEGKLLIPPQAQGNPIKGPEEFKTLALQALRSRLSNAQVDSLMVQDVYRLFASELMTGNYEAAQVHFAALTQMVEAIGGLHKLASYTMERVILSDIFSAVQRVSPPQLELTWDPGPLPCSINNKVINICGDSSLAGLGKTLLKLARANDFHPTMLSIISDLITLSQAHLVTWQTISSPPGSPRPFTKRVTRSPPPYTPDGMHILLLRRTALEHRLLSLSLPTNDHIQEAVRLTTVLFTGMTFADPARRTVTSGVRSRLREAITETNFQTDLWWPQTSLLLWISCIGSLASEETGDQELSEWFGCVVARCKVAEGLADLEAVEEVLGGFLWLEETQGDALERLVEKFDAWNLVD